MPKSEVVRFRIDLELKERLRKKAEEENRTMSNLLETLVLEALDNRTENIEKPVKKG